MDEIKQCPFCGGKAQAGHYKSSYKEDEHFLVMCVCCFARTVGETVEEAAKIWNRRVPDNDTIPR